MRKAKRSLLGLFGLIITALLLAVYSCTPVVEEPVVEEPVAEEKPATPHLTPVTWNPSNQKQKDFVHDSDSNIKAPGEKSFL